MRLLKLIATAALLLAAPATAQLSSLSNPGTNAAAVVSAVNGQPITPSSVTASGTVTGSNLSGTHSGNSSGTNTGDQTISLTGPVTGSGTGSFATTITAAAVTYPKIQNVAASSLLGNPTGSPAAPSEVTLGPGLVFSGTTIFPNTYLLCQSAVQSSITGTTAETTLATCTIPAGAMGANGSVLVEGSFSHTVNANAKTPRIKFGGTLVTGQAVGSSTASSRYGMRVYNRNSASSQIAALPASVLGPYAAGSSASATTMAINTANSTDITFTCQLGTSTDTCSLEAYNVIVSYRP